MGVGDVKFVRIESDIENAGVIDINHPYRPGTLVYTMLNYRRRCTIDIDYGNPKLPEDFAKLVLSGDSDRFIVRSTIIYNEWIPKFRYSDFEI